MRRVLTLVYLALSMHAVESIQADTMTEFRATLSAENVIREGSVDSESTATGAAIFTLMQPDDDPMGATMSYEIHTSGVDLNGEQTLDDLDDNMQGIHVHDTNVCVATGCESGDTAGTIHVLNIAGFPRNGDDKNDLVIDAPNNLVTGRMGRSRRQCHTSPDGAGVDRGGPVVRRGHLSDGAHESV